MFPWGTLHVHAALLAARLQMRLHPNAPAHRQWRAVEGRMECAYYPPHESGAVCAWSSGADRDPIAMSALCGCSQLSSPGRLRPHSQRPHTCRQMSAWAFDVSCSIGSQPAASRQPAATTAAPGVLDAFPRGTLHAHASLSCLLVLAWLLSACKGAARWTEEREERRAESARTGLLPCAAVAPERCLGGYSR